MDHSTIKYEDYLSPGFEWTDPDKKIVRGIIPDTLALRFHQKMPRGAALRELADEPLHLSYWETKYYKDAVSRFLEGENVEGMVIADIGCGDGRLTRHLLDMGCRKIIATDIDITVLRSLADFLEKIGQRRNVLIIHSAVEHLPLKSGIVDTALCIGLLYYLNEHYEDGLREVLRLLTPGGILINSEPDLEGALYKSLIFEKTEDIYENFFQKTFKEEQGDTPFKFRLFTEEEISEILTRHGQKIVSRYGLSLFASILRILTVRGLIDRQALVESEDKMRAVLDYLNGRGKLNKHILWKSVKGAKGDHA